MNSTFMSVIFQVEEEDDHPEEEQQQEEVDEVWYENKFGTTVDSILYSILFNCSLISRPTHRSSKEMLNKPRKIFKDCFCISRVPRKHLPANRNQFPKKARKKKSQHHPS